MGELENERETEADLAAEQEAEERTDATIEEEATLQDGELSSEPEPAPQPPAADSRKLAEKAAKRIETANAAHARKLGEILGEEANDLVPCPRCTHESLPFGGIAGFVIDSPMIPIDPAMKAMVLASVGEAPAVATKPDPYARQCDTCEGAGATLSGSRTNRDRTLTCHDCEGRGWIAVGDERRSGARAVLTPPSPNGPTEVAEQPPDSDPWGRTPDDPDYGRMPQYARRR